MKMAVKKKINTSTRALEVIIGSQVIATNVTLNKVFGSPIASMLLSQFVFYQITSKHTVRKNMPDKNGIERVFFTKKAREIWDETGISDDLVVSARKVLSSCGVLIEQLSSSMHYSIDIERLAEVINEYETTGKKVVEKAWHKGKVMPVKKGKIPIPSESEIPDLSETGLRQYRKEDSDSIVKQIPILSERTPLYILETKEKVIDTEKKEAFSIARSIIRSIEKPSISTLENEQSKTGVSLPVNEKKENEMTPSCAAPPAADEVEPQERPIPAKWLALIEKAAYRKPKTYIGNSQRVNEIELASEIVAAAMLAGADDLLCADLKQKNRMKPTDTLFHHFDDFIVNALTMGIAYQNQQEFRRHLRNFIPQNIKRLASAQENEPASRPQAIKTLTTADLKPHLA